MDSLVCTYCGTVYYSAAAAKMIERGEVCDCGGELRLVELPDDDGDQGVNFTVITSPSRIA